MNRLSLEHIQRNRLTRDAWDAFAPHRQRITELILSNRDLSPSGGRLCVLGAGNSNDLDLARLANSFTEIHLFDLDSEALAEGASRQFPEREPASKMFLRGGIDLSGIQEQMADWLAASPPPDEEISLLIEAARTTQFAFEPKEFDVVVSACLLTQLIDSLRLALSETHPLFNELLLAVRNRHLRLLAETVAPNGLGLLVTDFVSSDTCPELTHMSDAEIAKQAARWIAAGNFFSGVNPAALQARCREDAAVRTRFRKTAITQPWRWSLGSRCYAVYALSLR